MFENIMTMVQETSQNTGVSYTADIMSIATIVGMWRMLEKAGEPGWASLIPFYNLYKFCGVTIGNPWYWLRFFVFIIPVVGWVAGIYFMYQLCVATALAYGKPDSWKWGYLFLSGIFYCITGFDQSEYYGPMGVGDHRTAQAKESKTVSFDVTKTAPVQETPVQETPVQAEKAPEEDVDFFFDQPEE